MLDGNLPFCFFSISCFGMKLMRQIFLPLAQEYALVLHFLALSLMGELDLAHKLVSIKDRPLVASLHAGTNISGIASQFAMHFDPVCDAFSPVRCSNCDA